MRPEYFRDYNGFNTTLLMDLQVGLSLVVFAAVAFVVAPEVGLFDELDIILYCCYAALSVCWVGLGHAAVRRESKQMMWVFFALILVAPAYVAYSVYLFLADDKYDFVTNLTYPLIVLGGVLIVRLFSFKVPLLTYFYFWRQLVRMAVFAYGFFCYQNFGKGLKERVLEPNMEERRPLVVNL